MTINERIIELGFKQFIFSDDHPRYKRRNVTITVQEMSGTNIYVEVQKRGYVIELQKHDIKDVESAVKLIVKFIKKEVGR